MDDLDARKRAAGRVIDGASQELRALSLAIHEHPELNFEEHHAHAVLTGFLERKGFAVTRGACGLPTAFSAVAGQGGPHVAVLCEYDALPGIGHACGHNLIAIAGVAVGLAVKETLGTTSGTVHVIGTPAEEGGGGKIELIEKGAFDEIDVAMMVHPSPFDSAWMNVLAVDHLRVEYRGETAHAAAAPWEGRNALDALVLAYTNISAMRQQMLPSDRVHGIITDGGLKPNIIPDFAAAEYYVRARNRMELDRLRRRVVACFEGAARASFCELSIGLIPGQRPYADMVANDTLAAAYRTNLGRFGVAVPEKLRVLAGPGGSTDMGDVSYVVPSIHPMFAIPTSGGNHTPQFTAAAATPAAHEATLRAAKSLAFTAIDALGDGRLLEAAKAEFRAQSTAR